MQLNANFKRRIFKNKHSNCLKFKKTFLGNSSIKKEIKIEVTNQGRLNIRNSINITNPFTTTPFSKKYGRQ